MADKKELKQAQTVFKTLCEMLDGNGWHYERDEEKLSIKCGVEGDDLPIDVYMRVDAERQILTFLSELKFSIPEERIADVALAVSAVNYVLADGSFDLDITDGSLLFRMTAAFHGCLIGKDLLEYLLVVGCSTVDDYNDKFLMISKGKMTLQELIDFMQRD